MEIIEAEIDSSS